MQVTDPHRGGNAIRRPDVGVAVLVAAAMLVVYNSNGREMASFDSQPAKYAARELLLRGTLGLNHVVGTVPDLANRSAFVLARDGRYRSAYSPVPSIVAAAIAWPLWKSGVIDLRAPRAANLAAVIAASLLASASVALVFLTARRSLQTRWALGVAAAFGLGTGMWPTVSQTLWQHETAIFGLTLALYAFARDQIRPRDALAIGVGLAIAGTSRMQLGPAILVVLTGTLVRGGWQAGALSGAIVGASAAALMGFNVRWFGSLLGTAPMLEALHETVHAKSNSFGFSAEGLAGLLVSPSRGLLIFSPIVLVAAAGMSAAVRSGWRGPQRWCLAAAALQFLFYGSYSVWWGGHTFGPRYMLDVLPLLVPAGIAGAAWLRTPPRQTLAGLALAWSIAVSATGAFVFPQERWNTTPADVDRFHARLWDWSDPQIVRCWKAGASPQNFNLVRR